LVKEGRIHLVDKAAKYYVIDSATGKTITSRVLELAAAKPGGEAAKPDSDRAIHGLRSSRLKQILQAGPGLVARLLADLN